MREAITPYEKLRAFAVFGLKIDNSARPTSRYLRPRQGLGLLPSRRHEGFSLRLSVRRFASKIVKYAQFGPQIRTEQDLINRQKP